MTWGRYRALGPGLRRGGDVYEFAYFWYPEIGSAVEVLYLEPAAETAIAGAPAGA